MNVGYSLLYFANNRAKLPSYITVNAKLSRKHLANASCKLAWFVRVRNYQQGEIGGAILLARLLFPGGGGVGGAPRHNAQMVGA